MGDPLVKGDPRHWPKGRNCIEIHLNRLVNTDKLSAELAAALGGPLADKATCSYRGHVTSRVKFSGTPFGIFNDGSPLQDCPDCGMGVADADPHACAHIVIYEDSWQEEALVGFNENFSQVREDRQFKATGLTANQLASVTQAIKNHTA